MYKIRFYWFSRSTARRRADIMLMLRNVCDLEVRRINGRQRIIYGAEVSREDYPKILRWCGVLMCVSTATNATNDAHPESRPV